MARVVMEVPSATKVVFHARITVALWLVFIVALAAGDGEPVAKKKAGSDEATKVLMQRHSLTPPLQFKSVLSSWMTSGATIVERESVLLHPAANRRYGYFWNKLPVLTDNFEVTIHFKVNGSAEKKGRVPSDQAFAFWYLYDNIALIHDEDKVIKANEWGQGLKDEGMSFVGSLAKYRGFGAVLTMSDAANQKKSSVSLVSNDGSVNMEYGNGIPTASAKPIDFRNTLNSAQLKIRVTKSGVEGHFKQSPSLSWNECFKVDASNETKLEIKPGGYIGFSGFTGTGGDSDGVVITKLEVSNFDDTALGEEMMDVSAKIQDAYREMLTDENRHFLDQKSQTEHIQRLTAMLADHVKEVPKVETKINNDLARINDRLEKMTNDCKTVTKEFEVIVGDGELGGPAKPREFSSMKDDIVGIRQLLHKTGQTNKEKIKTVQIQVKEVAARKHDSGSSVSLDLIAKQTDQLEVTAEVRGKQMSWMFFVLVACVVIIGFMMYHRMHYYEKKHFF